MILHSFNRFILISLGLLGLSVSSANAAFIFSNVSYTANSVTFTADGDMSGYAAPIDAFYHDQFTLVYGGDIWNSASLDFQLNTWSQTVFDNETFRDTGRTGTSGNDYSWSRYFSSLADATAADRTVTLTMLSSRLDVKALAPTISFLWGNGSSFERYTVLQTVDLAASVPEPSIIALFAAGLFGIGFARRRRTHNKKR